MEVKFDDITKLLEKRGIKAYTEQTGGGCATIQVGEVQNVEEPLFEGFGGEVIGTTTVPRYAVLVGPGWFNGPGWTDARGDTDDLYVGPDDDGESPFYIATADDDAATIAEEVARQYAER